MRFPQIAVLLVAFLCAPVAAQQSGVSAHYRAYRAALERGDLATADAEATAALEASQLREGNGGSTAALALNAALVRLSGGHRELALAPAQLAASLAANPAAHIEPLVADIALKRAQLRLGDQSEAALLQALTNAHEHNDLLEYVYDGAVDLGGWAIQQQHLPTALEAWRIASHASPGDSDAAVLSRAYALVEVGISMFRIETNASQPLQQRTAPQPASNGHSGSPPSVEVYRVLLDAARILRPLAERPAPDGNLTRAQLLFARAMAFARAEYARLSDFGVDRSSVEEVSGSIKIAAHPGVTLCIIHPIAEPRPSYPSAAQRDLNVGAVVARFVIDGSGHVTDARTVATVGGATFEQSVSSVVGRWGVERGPGSAPNCDMAMTLFVPVVFGFR
jgi:TonB family protein